MRVRKRTSTASPMFFLVSERRAQPRTFLTCWQRGAHNHDLASSCVVLLWRNFPGQRHSAFCQWHDGTALPNSLCKAAGRRSFLVYGERFMGLLKHRCQLPSCGARWPVPWRQRTGAFMKNPTGAFRALSIFNFRVWSAGSLVSNIGTWMQRVAQDWLVLTQLTHHDASAVGIVMALQFAPQLLWLPWTGFAADHLNQRKLLMVTQATMGVFALALGILTITGNVRLWQVYVFAFLFGSAAALDAPVRQTFVAELVGDEHLHNAVALNSTSFNAGRMVGPAVAGLVIAKVGTG